MKNITYKIAEKADIDLVMKIRLEMLKVVNELSEHYIFSEQFIQRTIDFFEHGKQTTVLAMDSDVIACATMCYKVRISGFKGVYGLQHKIRQIGG